MSSLDPDRLLAVIATQNAIAAAGLELAPVMELVAERARAMTGADAAVIEMVEGDELVYRKAAGTAAPFAGMRLPVHGSLSGLCLQRGEVLCCRDARADPRVDAAAARRLGVISMVCVPLLHRAKPVGVLKLCDSRVDAFHEDDVATLELLSGLIAAAMANAGEFELQRYASRHDVVTGLPNRRAFDERLVAEVARVERYGGRLTLCLSDLDAFKQVNDRRGHSAGDDVLHAVGAGLRSVLREGDEAFRFGGDEFAVLFASTGRDGAEAAMRRVRAHLERDPICRGVGLSWGLVEADEQDARTLVLQADAALYQVKSARGGLRRALIASGAAR